MGKTAWVFPGQGAQKIGMGKDFFDNAGVAKEIYEQASDLLGLNMQELCFTPNEQLDLTEYTQAAMVTTCIAMIRVLREKGAALPDVTAGLSLGEYCSLVTAGVLSELDAIQLVRHRGILMQEAVPSDKGAMAAILMLDVDTIESVLASMEGVQIANYNCPGQIVISGYTEAVKEAMDKLKAAGAKRTLLLNVSGPFHSNLLEQAGVQLGKKLEKVELHALNRPYVTNVTAQYVENIEQIKPLLIKQVSSGVRWQQSVENMIADDVDTFIEIGPGKTLTGFIRKINKNVKTINVEKWEDMEKVLC